ncbi:forkhead box protein N3-like [Ylistrum balloti]|uniref:forkhead box protein N3-like n=1 Tax=Ylistrum balloti TaxID=509963 RepID=UPI002905D39E|nr:forkhead box protein N3-like [Ylistrum balloti]
MGKRKRCDMNDEENMNELPPSKLAFTDDPDRNSSQEHTDFGDPLPASLQQIEADLRKVMDDFVQVYERLDTGDDPTKKPNYSYTELVYLAVLRSPNFCLPITEIYRYIKSRFTFFRDSHRTHWKNAVRHSLSKTKCFTKIAVGKRHGIPGLPNRSSFLWCILPNSIVSFARGDYRPSVDKESGMNTLRWGYYKVNAGQFWSQVAVYLEKKFESFRLVVSASSDPRQIVKFQICSLPDTPVQSGYVETPEVVKHVTDSSGDILSTNFHVRYGVESDFLSKQDMEKSTDTGNSSTDDDFSPKSSSLSASINDSGHETLESSPEELSADLCSWRHPRHNLNSSYLSFLPSYPSNGRLTPELPDLGHVSPFELSPLSNHGASPPPSLLTSTQNLLRISPVPMMSPSYSESYNSYYSPYQSSHVMYPALHDLAYPYPVNYYPIQGNDPMLSMTPEWTGM